MNYALLILTNLLLLFTSYQAFSFQDIDKLLANPDITWVGEVYVDYHPHINILAPESEDSKNQHETIDYNAIEILKIKKQVSDDQLSPLPTLLSSKIFELNSKNFNLYKEADLKEKLSYKAYQEIIQQEVDEVKITFDPETYEQLIQVIKIPLNTSHIKQFRLKQVLSYNSKTNELNITPIALAPLQSINKFGSLPEKALFWMPIKEAFTTINLDHASIDWAKRFNKNISSDSIKTIKGTNNLSNLFIDMMTGYRTSPSTTKMYQIKHDHDQLIPFEPSFIQNIGIGLDTVISFNRETFEEMIEIVDIRLAAKDLPKIRITQDWAWDNKTQRMQIRVVGFAPIIYKADRNGNYSYTPFYYIRSKK